ncbi:MAG TPA: carbamoyl-phosphate synthase large subunit [Syntrophales bacterium]|nr:carbamoyl-phosphate synthase large subunit [Syntrophales bacterium]HQN78513.1 carbamoyl-phosphate synthase large subunit [Syntrophales bacterium]HQQ27398.1 carbamoyl-phosphate synthase large subunit [Syntrophales bacterium]
MPRRNDLKKILIIGSGPIVIGQACEFDYSGTQACKALIEEGYEVVLLNSNPATIMTDPDMAHRTYVEPITVEVLEKIIDRERPQAVLATIGGQTALNTAVEAAERGIFERYGVEMIGADRAAIRRAEDREEFKNAMREIGLEVPRSDIARSMEKARAIAGELGFPVVIRPSFTLGGTGGSVVYNQEEFERFAQFGMEQSMIGEILIEESVLGWKEFELEVMRDQKDNVVIVCSIENFDPMGIHTGDSITVAPAQTLTDREYQVLRNASIAVIRKIGVSTGGSNIQFAVHPGNGRVVVIEMNPRVSRSSALASKATGFPIARIAAKLAVGYSLDEIPNDITKKTPACFEPTIDYCVVKIPRFAFEKFPGADDTLTVSMKSVGETMAIGRTFKEALQKGLRGLETGIAGLDRKSERKIDPKQLEPRLVRPTPERIFYIRHALKTGMTVGRIAELTGIDPWFLHNLREIVDLETELESLAGVKEIPHTLLRRAKEFGFSDTQLGDLLGKTESAVRALREELRILPVYKLVDTCAAEFEAYTPYYYSTYEEEDESRPGTKKKIMIIGGGPNRIGQGIEFDYCCVHASMALRELGYETIMVNSNPETVSTDYDISDRLYFEPLTLEDVLNIARSEKPEGVIVQLGGQTPLNLAIPLARNGVPILGTSPDAIDRAEDRKLFRELMNKLKVRQPESDTALSLEEAEQIADRIGYPVLIRPSYVLGGRAMMVVWDRRDLAKFARQAFEASPEHPILIDQFLDDAIEVDVDAVADGERVVIGGVMEHIELAGIHSGDSAMVLPTYSLPKQAEERIRKTTREIALELGVRGLLNIQFAVKDGEVYILEVNPRGSRTVPFVSKATGVPLAKIATKVMAGISLKDQGILEDPKPKHYAVKESVLPFIRFPGVDTILGPEMKSTGEVMGIDPHPGMAFAKSQIAAGQRLPFSGKIFISVKDRDKKAIVEVGKRFREMRFEILSTPGTAKCLQENGIEVTSLPKLEEGRPNILDYIKNEDVHLLINTASGPMPRRDEVTIRSASVSYGIPLVTTAAGALAVVKGIRAMKAGQFEVRSLQEMYSSPPR